MFNPHARWDRRLPAGDSDTSEPVDVLARFARGRIMPLRFTVSTSTIIIKRVNYAWQQRRGSVVLYYFSVADGNDTYCLYLDSGTMAWRLLPAE